VTGGAGLIGSHIVDAALARGWKVRVLDNLERQTHRNGKPAWLSPEAEFMRGDVRHRGDWERALEGVDLVFHEAAYGGYMPEIAKFIHVNAVGTAIMLETIRDRNLPVRKVVIASSQAVYNEGAYACPVHGHFFGTTRPIAQLQAGDYNVHCPVCGAASVPAPTDERAPMGGENVYAISKADQERLLISWGRATGVPVVALRYSCTYGPRQSVFNPYTGVIAIFCTRLMNDLPPVIYEDGRQSRDLIFVQDVARANMIVACDNRADGRRLGLEWHAVVLRADGPGARIGPGACGDDVLHLVELVGAHRGLAAARRDRPGRAGRRRRAPCPRTGAWPRRPSPRTTRAPGRTPSSSARRRSPRARSRRRSAGTPGPA